MNATLGEIALNHALTHGEGRVDDVILENVEGAVEAASIGKMGTTHSDATEAPKAEAAPFRRETARNDAQNDAQTDVRNGAENDVGVASGMDGLKQTLRQRAEGVVTNLEEMARENPRKALAVAAGAGLVVGLSLLSFPLVRTLAKNAASAALKTATGGGGEGIAETVGSGLMDKLESILPIKMGKLDRSSSAARFPRCSPPRLSRTPR